MYSSYIGSILCMLIFNYVGLSVTQGNVQKVLQRSRVPESKNWLKTLRCFSFPVDDMEGDFSQNQRVQFLSEEWLDTEQDCQWWRLGIKLIRCCRSKEIATVHELMQNVAKYNHSGKLLCYHIMYTASYLSVCLFFK